MLYTTGFEVGQIWISRRFGDYTVKVTEIIHALTWDGFEYIKNVRLQYDDGREIVSDPDFLMGWFKLT